MAQVGVQVEESTQGSGSPTAVELDDTGFADFVLAGTHVSGEFRCADCGYGAVVQRELPQCPMCAGTIWESRLPRANRDVA